MSVQPEQAAKRAELSERGKVTIHAAIAARKAQLAAISYRDSALGGTTATGAPAEGFQKNTSTQRAK